MHRHRYQFILFFLVMVFVLQPKAFSAQSAEQVLSQLEFTRLYAWRKAGMQIDCQFMLLWNRLPWNKSWGSYRITMEQLLPSGWKYPIYDEFDRKFVDFTFWNCYNYHGGSKVRLSIIYKGKRYAAAEVSIKNKPKGFHPTQLRLQPYELYRKNNGTFCGRLAVINMSKFPYVEQGAPMYPFHVQIDYYNKASKWVNKWTIISWLDLKGGQTIKPRRAHVFRVKLSNHDWQKKKLPTNIDRLRYSLQVSANPNKGWKNYKRAFAKVTNLTPSQEEAYAHVKHADFHRLRAWKTLPGGRGGISFKWRSSWSADTAKHIKIFMQKYAKVKVGPKLTRKWLNVGCMQLPTKPTDYTKSFIVGNATMFRAYFSFMGLKYGLRKVPFKIKKAGRTAKGVGAQRKTSKPSARAASSKSRNRPRSVNTSLGLQGLRR